MLRAMIALATRGPAPGDEALDPALRELRGGLAEYPDPGDTAYVIERGGGALRARPVELDADARWRFPFIKPSGSQGAQLGPVIKRSLNAKREVSPGEKILATTVAWFEKVGAGGGAAAPVYRDALGVLGAGSVAERVTRLLAVLASIPAKKTAYVSIGAPPGESPEYAAHLLALLRAQRYGIEEGGAAGPCPVCGSVAPLAPNGLRGAGLNFTNLDNVGKFPGLREENAALRFAICAPCADALRAFKNNVAPGLRCVIAGEGALVIPEVTGEGAGGRSSRRALDVVAKAHEGGGTAAPEDALLRALERESSLASFHVLWATLGQDLDDVEGLVTDVPRTRLAELSAVNLRANAWRGGALPRRPLRDAPFDLRLSLLGDVLRHPGGARVKRANDGARLHALRRAVARAVYEGSRLAPGVLFRELRDIGASHLTEALSLEPGAALWWLTREADPKPNKPPTLTCAGWIRHAALCLRHLRELEVLDPMSATTFVPQSERLRAFFEHSGVGDDARAFAFLLGVLWGKLLTVQAARRVNVQSNALAWLRRGTLSGRDLPGLFARVRGKLLEYGTRSPEIADVEAELARVGLRLGDRVELDTDTAMYFLLLGQALALEVLPKKETEPS